MSVGMIHSGPSWFQRRAVRLAALAPGYSSWARVHSNLFEVRRRLVLGPGATESIVRAEWVEVGNLAQLWRTPREGGKGEVVGFTKGIRSQVHNSAAVAMRLVTSTALQFFF